jgi:hypothetical protein
MTTPPTPPKYDALAVISPRYFESGNATEESILQKVLDMGDRKRRLIPVTIEAVEKPIWMYSIVGVDFTDPEPLVPSLDLLKTTLGPPLP